MYQCHCAAYLGTKSLFSLVFNLFSPHERKEWNNALEVLDIFSNLCRTFSLPAMSRLWLRRLEHCYNYCQISSKYIIVLRICLVFYRWELFLLVLRWLPISWSPNIASLCDLGTSRSGSRPCAVMYRSAMAGKAGKVWSFPRFWVSIRSSKK